MKKVTEIYSEIQRNLFAFYSMRTKEDNQYQRLLKAKELINGLFDNEFIYDDREIHPVFEQNTPPFKEK